METNRYKNLTNKLIPYSVHLPEPLYNQIRAAAAQRKASAVIRDALEAYFKHQNTLDIGRQQGIEDCIRLLRNDAFFKSWSFKELPLSEMAARKLSNLIPKETKRGKGKS